MLRNMSNNAELPKIVIFGTIGYSILIRQHFKVKFELDMLIAYLSRVLILLAFHFSYWVLLEKRD